MNNIEALKLHTEEFFTSFWNEELGNMPEWSNEIWKFDGTVPNSETKGCYAHLISEEIVYIGVAIGNSKGVDTGSGIGQRVSNYWVTNPDKREGATKYIASSKAIGVTGIITIPFSNDKNYWFAAALEIYLLTKMSGLRNKTHN